MKRILFFLMAVAYSIMSQAAKAHPQPFAVTQSDGTQLTVILHGDEDFSYYTTTDNAILFRDGNNYFVANINSDGDITNSGLLAHNLSVRSVDEKNIIKRQNKAKFFRSVATKASLAKARRTALVEDNATLFPHTGTPKVLVALVEFNDVKFTVKEPKKAFEQYLNAERNGIEDLGNYDKRNAGSVAQYFEDSSFGKFRPQFDVLDPVILDKPLAYYGANNPKNKNNKDVNIYELLTDACKAVDGDVDFKDYDQNNDGKIDLVYVIYAGYSESWGGNSEDCIWPKSGASSSLSENKYDGVSLYRYGVSNELAYTPEYPITINGIGLFCHEFSHCMGMPDLYTTTAASEETQNADNQEMEYWSIMDSGTYLKAGFVPCAYTAWEREFFGWMDIEDLTEASAQIIEMNPIDKGGKAYRIKNTNDKSGNEYYILENIQHYGWNYYQYGKGMLVTHVNYEKSAFSLSSNSVNNILGKPRMTVLAADGRLMNYAYVGKGADEGEQYKRYLEFLNQAAGDPFPGTSNVTELTDDTEVRPIIYTGEKFNKPIYDIQESKDGIITFKYLDNTLTNIKDAIIETAPKDNNIYTIDGRFVGTDTAILKKGIYIIGNKKVIIK